MMATISQPLEPAFPADQRWIRDIGHELHETAQPLAVLQGILELALLNACTADDYREVCIHALDELERTMRHFDHIRNVLRAQRPASQGTTYPRRKEQNESHE